MGYIADAWALPVGGVAIYLAVSAFFAHFAGLMSSDAKRKIVAYLDRTDVPGRVAQWPKQFIALFDRLFGGRHWSLKCFFRSCIASVAVMLMLGVIWALLRPDAAVLYAERINEHLFENLMFFIMFNIFWNMFSDYFSLLACRYILGLMAKRRVAVVASLAYAALGTLASAMTYVLVTVYVGIVVAVAFWYCVVPVPFEEVNLIFVEYMKELWNNGIVFDSRPGSGSIGIFFYSALFTSIWAWLYVASTATIRAIARLDPALAFLRSNMNLDEKPLACIGSVAGLMAVLMWSVLVVAGVPFPSTVAPHHP